MGNKTLAPVLGKGTAVISLNGKMVLVHNVLHVHTLRTPLYSLRKHLTQQGCGFIGDDSLGGLFVYFPAFVLAVDTTKDFRLSYKPIGSKASLKDLAYVQPRCKCKVLPLPPADWEGIQYARHTAKQAPSPIPSVTQDSGSSHDSQPSKAVPPVANLPPAVVPVPTPSASKIKLLSTMSHEEVIKHMHHPNITLPAIRTCSTCTGSDKQKRYSAEEIH